MGWGHVKALLGGGRIYVIFENTCSLSTSQKTSQKTVFRRFHFNP